MKILVTLMLIMPFAGASFAGALSNGVWTPAKCGDKPAAPLVEDQNVDAYNSSVKAFNEWQQQANTYYNCIVSEANADTATIAAKANQDQTEFKKTFDGISAALDAAHKKVTAK
ncbi:MAG: hypothetical protein ABSB19_00695 [Methylomonas sp.]